MNEELFEDFEWSEELLTFEEWIGKPALQSSFLDEVMADG